ncbi:hypothetical protein LZC95_25260 [Pendulispora brunnea]|uniref:Uncharacterized protein n=1 Tax=Pendulispora brunnea TaxID=2905690 RepID=A0ABZ2KNK7_9BACT
MSNLKWHVAVIVILLIGDGVLQSACLTRPVASGAPTTKVNFATVVRQSAVDKVDLLFAIDNSSSMGDKQAYLGEAIPDLVNRLTTPNCVDANEVVGISHDHGICDRGKVEFPPVHDMHIAIVSSALGPRGGDICDPGATVTVGGRTLNRHNDDRGHLLNRAMDAEIELPSAGPSHFLTWLPSSGEKNGKPSGAPGIEQPEVLSNDFQSMVTGVHAYGCGIESQLESWYRFLIQPDPYDDIALDSNGKATWNGVDVTILKQRHDFLRPDSLVAVIVLTDENDSEIDVRSADQSGYKFMSTTFKPPRGTSACTSNPADPNCTSCAFLPNGGAGDPNCAKGNYTDPNDWGYDPNLRHVHMKAKYGFEPQFPISRYVVGLTAKAVPDRIGEYPSGAKNYVGDAKCTNPLFAASLPDGSSTDAAALCHLASGPRTSDSIFYAHIGGVPHELLHFDPRDPEASAIREEDWVKILGKNPEAYDYTGIDPHMIESVAPRAGLAGPGASNDADPIHGREWITDQGAGHILPVDRQFACIFPLAKPRDCTLADNADACDCPSKPTLTAAQAPPVCNPSKQTEQIAAKAYPTIRELLLAKKIGEQGIVSSICPIHVTEQSAGDPLYGYRPAVSAIVDRLKSALTERCVPQPLEEETDGTVPCLVLELLPGAGDQSTACDSSKGLEQPDPGVLRRYRAAQQANGDTDGLARPLCVMKQLKGEELVQSSAKSPRGRDGATSPGPRVPRKSARRPSSSRNGACRRATRW